MRKIILLALLLWATAAPADILPKIDTAENRRILTRVEQAYNAIRSLKAQFAQFNSRMKDDLQTGTLYLQKPGKMRLVYERGSPLEFYAFDGYFVYHDKELKEVSSFELSQTPVELILKDTLRFSDPGFVVTEVRDVLDEYFVTVIKKDAAELGSLTLVIDKESLQLKQWDVLDMQGIKSTVSLFDTQVNAPLQQSLFRFQNPYR